MSKIDDLPEWLRDAVQLACEAHEVGLGHIGWSAVFGVDGWEVWIYPMLVEMVGGAHDGAECLPGHRRVDVTAVASLFDEPPNMDWMHCSDEATELSLEGKVKGHDLWVHLQEEPPKDVHATATFDVNSGTFQEKGPCEDE